MEASWGSVGERILPPGLPRMRRFLPTGRTEVIRLVLELISAACTEHGSLLLEVYDAVAYEVPFAETLAKDTPLASGPAQITIAPIRKTPAASAPIAVA